jgi:hypothetical protein
MNPAKIEAAWKSTERCFVNSSGNPVMQDLLYCGLAFLREAMKASFGDRPQSSNRIALQLAANRARRLRIYQRAHKKSLPTILAFPSRNHV